MHCDIFIEILSRFTNSHNVFISFLFPSSPKADQNVKRTKLKYATTAIDAGTLMNAESGFAWRSVTGHCKREQSSMEMSLLPKLRWCRTVFFHQKSGKRVNCKPQSPWGLESWGPKRLNAVFNGLEWTPDEYWRAGTEGGNRCVTHFHTSQNEAFQNKRR